MPNILIFSFRSLDLYTDLLCEMILWLTPCLRSKIHGANSHNSRKDMVESLVMQEVV